MRPGRSIVISNLRLILRFGAPVFGVPWLTLGIYQAYAGYKEYEGLVGMARAGHEQVVEGFVRNFSPYGAHRSQHPKESFSVDDRTFYYPPDDLSLMPGYNQTRAKGGPIANGVYVRVHYIEDRIVKLEVCRPFTTLLEHQQHAVYAASKLSDRKMTK